MNSSYAEKFNVLEVFEENKYQKIIMGTKKSNPEDVVVINVFKKNEFLDSKFVSDLFSYLRFLAFFEEKESEIAIATDYSEGMSLSSYIENNNLTYKERQELAIEYLDQLSNYESFNPYFLKIFSEEKQLIIDNKELKFSELIVIDENIEKSHNFDNVTETIGKTLNEIMFFNSDFVSSISPLKNYISALLSNTIKPTSIEEIKKELKTSFDNSHFEKSEEIKEKPIVAPIPVPVENVETVKTSENIEVDKNTETNVKDTPAEVKTELKDAAKVNEIPLEDESSFESKDNFEEEGIVEETPIADMVEKNTEKVVELENITFSNPELDEMLSSEVEEKEKKPNRTMWLFLIAIIAIIAIFGKFVFFKGSGELPLASFERIKQEEKILFKNTSKAIGSNNEIVISQWIVTSDDTELLNTTDNYDLELKFKNDGTYKVALKVQDKNGAWSETYFEEFDYVASTLSSLEDSTLALDDESNEKLNKYSILLDENAKYSEDIKRSGNKSIELDLESNDGTAEIVLDGIFLDNQYIISLWLMANSNEPVKIEFTGYNNGTMKFVKTVTHNPTSANIWEMVEVAGGNTLIDKLNIKFISNNKTIWVDDIELNSYK